MLHPVHGERFALVEVIPVAAEKQLLVRNQTFQRLEVGFEVFQVIRPPGPQAELVNGIEMWQ